MVNGAPTLNEIFAVMAAASTGNITTRVDLPEPPDASDDMTRIAIALNLLLDDLGERDALLRRQLDTIQRQQRAIAELSIPILRAAEHVLVLPLIGVIDAERAKRMTTSLLTEIVRVRARIAIVDLTGVPEVDDAAARALVDAARATKLMGVKPVLSGLGAKVATRLGNAGDDLDGLAVMPDLMSALESAIRG